MDGMVFKYVYEEGDSVSHADFVARISDNLTIRNCTFTGDHNELYGVTDYAVGTALPFLYVAAMPPSPPQACLDMDPEARPSCDALFEFELFTADRFDKVFPEQLRAVLKRVHPGSESKPKKRRSRTHTEEGPSAAPSPLPEAEAAPSPSPATAAAATTAAPAAKKAAASVPSSPKKTHPYGYSHPAHVHAHAHTEKKPQVGHHTLHGAHRQSSPRPEGSRDATPVPPASPDKGGMREVAGLPTLVAHAAGKPGGSKKLSLPHLGKHKKEPAPKRCRRCPGAAWRAVGRASVSLTPPSPLLPLCPDARSWRWHREEKGPSQRAQGDGVRHLQAPT